MTEVRCRLKSWASQRTAAAGLQSADWGDAVVVAVAAVGQGAGAAGQGRLEEVAVLVPQPA